MSTGNTPRDDAELEVFLGRESSLSADYDNLERVEPPAALDDKFLALAKVSARPALKPASPKPAAVKPAPVVPVVAAPAAGASSASHASPAERRKRPRPPKPEDGDDDAPPSRRPRWLVPTALAASVLVAVGVGLMMFGGDSSDPDSGEVSPLGSVFARRARERSEADKAAAEAAAGQEAEVVELELAPIPPPPVFEPEGPQVQDLDAAIALIRKELVMANQMAAIQEEARAAVPGSVADAQAPAAPAGAPAASPGAPSVIQPRDRRLTKILELYDGGNPDLAADSLEIFLRDFEDDPISQRILAVKP